MADFLPLQSIDQLRDLLESSGQQPLAIFKHSLTCPISAMAKARVERALLRDELSIPVYYLDLLNHRPVSNAVAEELQVIHESPQLILVDKGKAVFHASHLEIDPADLARFA